MPTLVWLSTSFFWHRWATLYGCRKAPNERSREWRPGLRAGSGLAVYWQRVVATPARTVVVQVTGWGTLTVGAGRGLKPGCPDRSWSARARLAANVCAWCWASASCLDLASAASLSIESKRQRPYSGV